MVHETDTVPEFCAVHKISRGTFYNLLKAGKGPKVLKVGSRTLITKESAAEWRRQREVEGYLQGGAADGAS